MRVVLDTNVLVSALIRRASVPGALLEAWRDGRLEVVVSPALLAELERVLAYPRLRRYLALTADEARSLVAELRDVALIADAGYVEEVTRDPDDDHVLAAAVAGGADDIVSADNDLLELGDYHGIEIVTPAQIIAIVSELAGRG